MRLTDIDDMSYDQLTQLTRGHGVTIDPGVNKTGVAVWRKPGDLLFHATTHKPGGANRATRIINAGSAIADLLVDTPFQWVAIESIEFWSGSAASHASMVRGDALSVCLVIGYLLSALEQMEVDKGPLRVVLCPVRTWKGQLPDKALGERIYRHFGQAVGSNEHERDAIGLGLFLAGAL